MKSYQRNKPAGSGRNCLKISTKIKTSTLQVTSLDSILAKTAENVLVGHFRTSPANWYQICIRNQSLNVSYSLVSLYIVLGGKYAVLVVTIPAMQVLLIAKQFLMHHSASYCSLLVLLQ